MIPPDTIFAHEGIVVLHPFNYSYLSNEDPFVAHEINMLRIEAQLDKMVDKALAKLDKMVYDMDQKYDPKVVVCLPNTEVVENEDGSFDFFTQRGIEQAKEVYTATERELSADYVGKYLV